MAAPSLYSPRRIVAKQRATRAMEMRLAGATYQEIADALGWSHRNVAYRAIVRGIDRMMEEPVARIRKLQIRRYERLLHALWAQAIGGDVRALQVAQTYLARLDRVHGIELETIRHEHAGPQGGPIPIEISAMPIDDVKQSVRELLERRGRAIAAGPAAAGEAAGGDGAHA